MAPFGLFIDECDIKDNSCFIPFLDIQFCMDSEGELQTDLYIKPTDSRSYLHFSSTHPNHVYTGIVYSQCIRLRRIINSQTRLEIRMKDLCEAFIKCGYPTSMVENISKKVLNQPRLLDKTLQINIPQTLEKKNIQIVTTFGTDEEIIKAASNAEPKLLATKSFSKVTKPLFSFVKKNAPNIGSKLAIVKRIALESQYVGTSKCGSPRCQCDILVPEIPLPKITVNGYNV